MFRDWVIVKVQFYLLYYYFFIHVYDMVKSILYLIFYVIVLNSDVSAT